MDKIPKKNIIIRIQLLIIVAGCSQKVRTYKYGVLSKKFF